MFKKHLIVAILIVPAFFNCGKSGDDPSNITGTWTEIKQVRTNGSNSATYDESNTPCIDNSKLTINKDGTFASSFTGTDTCFVYQNGIEQGTTGQPGSHTNGTWTGSGSTFVLSATVSGRSYIANGQITGSGAGTLLVFTSTITGLDGSITSTYSKK